MSIADECAAELRSHDDRHATGTTDFELYISMFVPQSSGCFHLCLSLHGTCRALAQMYILVTHMIALQLPFHLTTVGPLAPYKSCVSHPCIARACTDCDPTIWYFVFILYHIRNPTFTKCSDKRLSIDLAALRQMVWLTPDGELREKIGSDQPDMVRWIETSCMVADCLTKRTRSDRLSGCPIVLA